jgi:hypothetical protein
LLCAAAAAHALTLATAAAAREPLCDAAAHTLLFAAVTAARELLCAAVTINIPPRAAAAASCSRPCRHAPLRKAHAAAAANAAVTATDTPGCTACCV